eukprot:TRINITY_DN35633_c0_g1_i1.p1 TRINITY_DN35633_c0_g1~~TRINITY_DN35633_c0_g1_i1.p1  ORF type:complete len:105 (+),score=35.87 TRINITY_DN35633_c0_g1_i1:67-381(+)
MIRRPPRSTLSSSSAASDVYKRQAVGRKRKPRRMPTAPRREFEGDDHEKSAAAVLMKKVRGKRNVMLESLLDNDEHGDGSVSHQQLREGLKSCLLYTSPSPRDS